MPGPLLMHQRDIHILRCPLIAETEFLLNASGLGISFIVPAPDSAHAEVFKTIPDQLRCSFRHDALSPEGFCQPVSQFAFIIPLRHVRMPVQLQLDCANRPVFRLQTDRKAGLMTQYMADHIQAFFHGLMRRPPGNRAHIRAPRVLIEAFRISFLPCPENQPSCFKIPHAVSSLFLFVSFL